MSVLLIRQRTKRIIDYYNTRNEMNVALPYFTLLYDTMYDEYKQWCACVLLMCAVSSLKSEIDITTILMTWLDSSVFRPSLSKKMEYVTMLHIHIYLWCIMLRSFSSVHSCYFSACITMHAVSFACAVAIAIDSTSTPRMVS